MSLEVAKRVDLKSAHCKKEMVIMWLNEGI